MGAPKAHFVVVREEPGTQLSVQTARVAGPSRPSIVRRQSLPAPALETIPPDTPLRIDRNCHPRRGPAARGSTRSRQVPRKKNQFAIVHWFISGSTAVFLFAIDDQAPTPRPFFRPPKTEARAERPHIGYAFTPGQPPSARKQPLGGGLPTSGNPAPVPTSVAPGEPARLSVAPALCSVEQPSRRLLYVTTAPIRPAGSILKVDGPSAVERNPRSPSSNPTRSLLPASRGVEAGSPEHPGPPFVPVPSGFASLRRGKN